MTDHRDSRDLCLARALTTLLTLRLKNLTFAVVQWCTVHTAQCFVIMLFKLFWFLRITRIYNQQERLLLWSRFDNSFDAPSGKCDHCDHAFSNVMTLKKHKKIE